MKRIYSSKASPEHRQAGMVAIMVTLILMTVISLIVLGFAQISRRNQRQALDRQLSTQAFYAAETGVNDADELIKDAIKNGVSVASKTDCAPASGAFYASLNPVLDASNKVEYTCLLVEPTPSSLSYSGVGINSTIIPLIATSGTIANVSIVWQTKDDTTTPSVNCPTTTTKVFVPKTSASWNCGYGVLRIDFVPTAGSSLSMAGLQSATMSSFLVPLISGSTGATNSITYGSGAINNLVGISCTNTNCQLTISTGATPQSQYYMRVSSIYKDVSLQVSATDGSGTAVRLQGAQAVVDVTGKAQDVLRRIQVRVPLIGSSSNQLSDYAIQSGEAICKRFSAMDGFFNNEADDVVAGVSSSTSNPLCAP
jgi:Tfp pilus assembly protein PilX